MKKARMADAQKICAGGRLKALKITLGLIFIGLAVWALREPKTNRFSIRLQALVVGLILMILGTWLIALGVIENG